MSAKFFPKSVKKIESRCPCSIKSNNKKSELNSMIFGHKMVLDFAISCKPCASFMNISLGKLPHFKKYEMFPHVILYAFAMHPPPIL